MNKYFLKFILILIIAPQAIFAQESKFLLILGPSGAGKSTIIKHLQAIDPRFQYITPFTTRKLREGEKDKIHTSLKHIEKLKEQGNLLAINEIYGIYYATPKHLIDDALDKNNFPILDWPVEKMDIMQKAYPERLYTVYLEPDNLDELEARLLVDDRNKDGKRLKAGEKELINFFQRKYDNVIDLKVVNRKGCSNETAKIIYANFLLQID